MCPSWTFFYILEKSLRPETFCWSGFILLPFAGLLYRVRAVGWVQESPDLGVWEERAFFQSQKEWEERRSKWRP